MSLDIDKYGVMQSSPPANQPGKRPQIKKICLLGLPSPHSLLRKWDENSQIRSEFNRIVFSFSSSPHYQSALALIIYHRNHWISHWVYRFSYRNDLLWLVISLLEVYGNNLTVTDWYHFATVDCQLSDYIGIPTHRFLKHPSCLTSLLFCNWLSWFTQNMKCYIGWYS